MIKEIITTEDGREFVTWRAENAADERELRRKAEAGELDVGDKDSDFDAQVEQDLIDAGIITPD